MFKFIVFDIFCWLGLCVLGVIFIFEQRKKTLSLRSFLKLAKNRSPEKWVVKEDAKGSGFYEYSTEIAGFCLRIEKYPKKKRKNGNEIICCSYRMFVSTEEGVSLTFEDNRKIAKTYNKIHQERRRMEKVIEKWQKSGARIRREDVLASA